MAPVPTEKTRIFAETFKELQEESGSTCEKLSFAMGHSASYLANKFARGIATFHAPEVKLLCLLLGCTEEELTAMPERERAKYNHLPRAEKSEAKQTAPPVNMDEIANRAANIIADACKYNGASARQFEEMYQQITAGFAMLHTDIRNLIETMDKYWKPEPMPTIDRGQAEKYCRRKEEGGMTYQ